MLDAPRGVAQKKDIAGIAFDGKILVERADHGAVFIGRDDAIAGDLGNGAAAGDGCEPGSFPRSHAVVDAVAVHIRAPAATLGRDPLAEHVQNVVEIFS